MSQNQSKGKLRELLNRETIWTLLKGSLIQYLEETKNKSSKNKRKRKFMIFQMILMISTISWDRPRRSQQTRLQTWMTKMISLEEASVASLRSQIIARKTKTLIIVILWHSCKELKPKKNKQPIKKRDRCKMPRKHGRKRSNWIIIWILNLWTIKISGKRIWGTTCIKTGQIFLQ